MLCRRYCWSLGGAQKDTYWDDRDDHQITREINEKKESVHWCLITVVLKYIILHYTSRLLIYYYRWECECFYYWTYYLIGYCLSKYVHFIYIFVSLFRYGQSTAICLSIRMYVYLDNFCIKVYKTYIPVSVYNRISVCFLNEKGEWGNMLYLQLLLLLHLQ